jgi:hypothetical protein
MDATLMFSANATPSPASVAHSSASASSAAQIARGVDSAAEQGSPQNTPNGRIFSGLMRGLLPTHERQDVAAATDPATTTTEPGDLKTELLGAQLNVITTSNAIPDPSSLTAFAKAQGLDEAAVKALFGDMAALSTKTGAAPALPNMTVITDPAAAPVDVAWLANQLSAEITVQFSGMKTGQTAIQTKAQTAASELTANVTGDASTSVMGWNMMTNGVPQMTSGVSIATAPSGATQLSALTSVSALTNTNEGASLSLTPQTGAGGSPLSMNATITPIGLSPLAIAPLTLAPLTPSTSITLAAGAALSSLLPTALPANTAGVVKPSLDTPIAASEGLDLLAPAAPLPEDAMRIRLVPAWSVVTQQLTQMSGTAMTSAWGALTATTLGAPIRSVALDLSTPLASDSEDIGSINGTDSGWSTQGSELNRPGTLNTSLPTAVPVPGMAQTLRQEHYQQLADRLGQAMAERLQSQIARGEWKLQMRLNPANLGRIDVELDMHAKGLDAMFRFENPLTRELMVQSMPKLKDTLSQSGMAVASVWVNSDAGRQSDGNPTPQKDRTDVSDTSTSVPTEVGAVPATKAQRSPDGFDVLA